MKSTEQKIKIGITAGKGQASGPSNRKLRAMLGTWNGTREDSDYIVTHVDIPVDQVLHDQDRREMMEELNSGKSILEVVHFNDIRKSYEEILTKGNIEGLVIPGSTDDVHPAISKSPDSERHNIIGAVGSDERTDADNRRFDESVNNIACIDAAYKLTIPSYGICKGLQLLAIHSGDTLQDRDQKMVPDDVDELKLYVPTYALADEQGLWDDNTFNQVSNMEHYTNMNLYENVTTFRHFMHIKGEGQMNVAGYAINTTDMKKNDIKLGYPAAAIDDSRLRRGTQFHPELVYETDGTAKQTPKKDFGDAIMNGFLNAVNAASDYRALKDKKKPLELPGL